jgi:carotenoid 1,2-hydratase
VIAFVGSVFSPYYALARRRGATSPLDHCALNVALYGKNGKRWTLTERPRGVVGRSDAALTIGPSMLSWDGRGLTIEIDEIAVPIPRHVRGRVRLYPDALNRHAFALDESGRHLWQPLAPVARIEVAMERPALFWTGSAYFDWNGGASPLESEFAGWHWSRARLPHGAAVLYDVTRRHGGALSLALRFDHHGNAEPFPPPPESRLPPTRWRLPRATRADRGFASAVVKTLEDTPFYARSVLSARLLGEPVAAIHESLSLDRFRTNWVKLLLPFRMPRARR